MVNYKELPIAKKMIGKKEVNIFSIASQNIDIDTVTSFGEEWTKFDAFSDEEIKVAGDQYFDIVPESYYIGKSIMDMGCGTGRWTKYVCKKALSVDAVDPSDAIYVAANFLKEEDNVRFSKAAVENLPFGDNSFDFVFSLGVLHHIPDTQKAMNRCVSKLKQGGYFLVYLYYSLDNRSLPFKLLFYISDFLRRFISKMPGTFKRLCCDFLAITVYMPFVIFSKVLNILGLQKITRFIPLSYYTNKSFNIIRNDSLDRFGTPLEQRFSKKEIKAMMENSGLKDIIFSENEPYWHAIGVKK